MTHEELAAYCLAEPTVAVSAYIGRYGWNSVALDGTIPDDELRELVDESYAAVVAKLPRSKRP